MLDQAMWTDSGSSDIRRPSRACRPWSLATRRVGGAGDSHRSFHPRRAVLLPLAQDVRKTGDHIETHHEQEQAKEFLIVTLGNELSEGFLLVGVSTRRRSLRENTSACNVRSSSARLTDEI